MSRTIKEVTEELYPIACGKGYVPDDIAHEGMSMKISWRMAGAIHFLLLDVLNRCNFVLERKDMDDVVRRRWELWGELAGEIICRICKAKNHDIFETTPMDECTEFAREGGAE